jgi:hypothetical protein
MAASLPESSRWHALPHFFLRQAGFPFDTLAVLESQELPAFAERIEEADLVVEHRRAGLLRALRGDGGIAAAKVRKLVAAYRMVPGRRTAQLDAAVRLAMDAEGWNDALADARALREQFAEAYRGYQRRCARDVRALFLGDPALLDAALLSNQDNYGEVVDWLARLDADRLSRTDRRRLDLLVMYLQRFCAKNDTNAHFGPISIGDVRPSAANLAYHPDATVHRYTFVARWAADAVAAKAWAEGVVACRPRTTPTALVDSGGAHLVRYRFVPHWDAILEGPIPLAPGEAELLHLCDGSRTVAEVERLWGRSGGSGRRADFAASLAALARHGLVIVGSDLPVGTPQPLDELAKVVDASGWQAVVTDFTERVTDFGVARDTDQRRAQFDRANEIFRRVTGKEPSRRHGQMYADRSILYEECVRGTEALVVGGDLLRTVERDLGRYLDLLLLPARVRLHRQRLLLRDWFAKAFPEGRAPLLAYLRGYQADAAGLTGEFDAVENEIEEVQRDIEALLVGPAPDDVTEVELDDDAVRQFVDRRQPLVPALCNPDVMVIARSVAAVQEGDFRIVVGDCHAVREAISHTSISCLVAQARPDFPAAVRRAYGDLLAADELLVDLVREHDEKTAVQLPVADFDLELAGRSARERSRVLSYRDLEVRLDDRRLRLFSPRIGSYLVLTAAPVGGTSARGDPLAIFGFPRHFSGTALRCSDRPHLPRVRMGRVVLNRETWQLDVAEVVAYAPRGAPLEPDDDPDGVLRLTLNRRARGLPRFTFVLVPGEAKPVFVDFESPALVRQLWRLLRGRSGTVQITEMLPGPDQLWLDNGTGRLCSELRMAVFAAGCRR